MAEQPKPRFSDAARAAAEELRVAAERSLREAGYVKHTYPDGSARWIRPEEQTPEEQDQSSRSRARIRAHRLVDRIFDWLER